MDELLYKSTSRNMPLVNQEYYHLRLREFQNGHEPCYCVFESHTHWDEKERLMVWEHEQSETFTSLDRARTRYAERRLFLEQRGFVHSDIDPF